jgi:acylphosphatase
MDHIISKRVVVSGLVQGVGFRFWARSAAVGLGLDGWVRNLPDGRVEIQVSGSVDSVEGMIELLETGPSHARVTDVESHPAEYDGLGGFEIRL